MQRDAVIIASLRARVKGRAGDRGREKILADQQGTASPVEQRTPGDFGLSADLRAAQAGFQRAPLPVGAAEQVGAEGFAAEVTKPAAGPLEAGHGNNGAGQYPGRTIATQADLADPGTLTQGNGQVAGFFQGWCGKAFPLHFHMEGPGTGFFNAAVKEPSTCSQ